MALVTNATRELKKIYRQTFEIKKAGIGSVHLHSLLINPEDLQMDEPARVSVTQTLGGAFVTDFGQGLPTVSMSGTTGYKRRKSAEGIDTDGFDEFVRLRNLYRNYITANDPTMTMYWYNWEDSEFYQIQPQNFRLMRNKSESLLYRYEIRFICLRKLAQTRQDVMVDYLRNNPDVRANWSSAVAALSTMGEVMVRMMGGQ